MGINRNSKFNLITILFAMLLLISISNAKTTPNLTLTVPKNSTYNASIGSITYGLRNNNINASLKLTLSINGKNVSNFTTYGNTKAMVELEGPEDIAVSPNGEYAYVTTYGNSTMSIVNLTTYTIIKNITELEIPFGVAVSPNGEYAYIVNNGYSTLSIVNLTTDKIVKTIQGLDSPVGVAISPNGEYAYVTNNGNNSMSVVDLTTDTIIKNTTGLNSPFNIAVSPNGEYAYINSDNKLIVVNLTSDTIVKTITGFDETFGVAVSPNGEYAYVTNIQNATLSIVNLTSDTIVKTITGFNQPYGLTISHNGEYAYVVNWENNALSTVNLTTDKIVKTINRFNSTVGVSASYKSGDTYPLSLNPGTYRVNVSTKGNSKYNPNTLSKVFVISKASPALNLKVCSDYTYDGKGCRIKASISSKHYQLKGNLYVNGALVGNTTNNITYTSSPDSGIYNVTFSTIGDDNFTPDSINKSYEIYRIINESNTINESKKIVTTIGNSANLSVNADQLSVFKFMGLNFTIRIRPDIHTKIYVNAYNYTGDMTNIKSCYSSIYAIYYNTTYTSNGNATISYPIQYKNKIKPFECVDGSWEPINYTSISNNFVINLQNKGLIGLLYDNYTPKTTKVAPINRSVRLIINQTEGNAYINNVIKDNSTFNVALNRIVEFKVVPREGYRFIGWEGIGNGSYIGNDSTFNITIKGNITEIPILYKIKVAKSVKYTLRVSVNPTFGGVAYAVPGKSSFNKNSIVSVYEIPKSNYTFTGWTCYGAGCYSGNDPAFNLIIKNNTIEIAHFIPSKVLTNTTLSSINKLNSSNMPIYISKIVTIIERWLYK